MNLFSLRRVNLRRAILIAAESPAIPIISPLTERSFESRGLPGPHCPASILLFSRSRPSLCRSCCRSKSATCSVTWTANLCPHLVSSLGTKPARCPAFRLLCLRRVIWLDDVRNEENHVQNSYEIYLNKKISIVIRLLQSALGTHLYIVIKLYYKNNDLELTDDEMSVIHLTYYKYFERFPFTRKLTWRELTVLTYLFSRSCHFPLSFQLLYLFNSWPCRVFILQLFIDRQSKRKVFRVFCTCAGPIAHVVIYLLILTHLARILSTTFLASGRHQTGFLRRAATGGFTSSGKRDSSYVTIWTYTNIMSCVSRISCR